MQNWQILYESDKAKRWKKYLKKGPNGLDWEFMRDPMPAHPLHPLANGHDEFSEKI